MVSPYMFVLIIYSKIREIHGIHLEREKSLIKIKKKKKTLCLDNLPDMLLWEIEMHGLQTVFRQ